MPSVYVVGGDAGIEDMFEEEGWHVDNENYKEVDLFQFTGGADVSPELYGEENTDSFTSKQRDLVESSFFNSARLYGIPMAGICRGAQFLNVMNGGKMLQDIPGNVHCRGSHMAYDQRVEEGEAAFVVTSTHHQMIIPTKSAQLLLTAVQSKYDLLYPYKTGNNLLLREGIGGRAILTEVESVYYHASRSFCYQPHPEYVGKDDPCRRWYFDRIEEFFGLRAA